MAIHAYVLTNDQRILHPTSTSTLWSAHSGVVALSFLSMVEALTYANTFYLFALFCFASTVFYGILLPETKVQSRRTGEARLSD